VNADGFYYNNSSTMQNIGIVYGLKELGAKIDLLTLQPQKGTVGFDPSMQTVLDECIEHVYFIPLNSLYQRLNKEKKHVVENTGHENKTLSAVKGSVRRFIKNLLVFDLRILNLHNVDKVNIDLDQYDVVISASDPKSTHCMANRLVQQHDYQGRYIQYWGDPLYLDITRDRSILDGVCKSMEKRALQPASKIVYATPFTLKEQQELYPDLAGKMSYAHQAAVPVSNCNNLNQGNSKNVLSLVYCGDYRKETRNIMPLYQAVQNLKDDVELNIYGTSNLQLVSTDNVFVHGQVSRKEADQAEMEADVLVCICNLKGSQIPGKIYYLTSYDKPIIVVIDGEYTNKLKKYLTDLKRFVVCENTDRDIKEAIQFVKSNNKDSFSGDKNEFTPKYMAINILK
jgi:hypothetical protein